MKIARIGRGNLSVRADLFIYTKNVDITEDCDQLFCHGKTPFSD